MDNNNRTTKDSEKTDIASVAQSVEPVAPGDLGKLLRQ